MNSASIHKNTLQDCIIEKLSVFALSTTLCLNLCGCSTTSETFDCQPGKGVGCKSISEVNQLVNQQTGGKDTEQDKQSILSHNTESFPTPIIVANSPGSEASKASVNNITLSDTHTVQRMPEEYLRVWVAPFQDQQGNLHEGSIIHTVLKPGYWKMLSTQESGESHQTPDMKD